MTNITSRDRTGIRQALTEYTTLELVSVLTHAENSRRQMDRFVERVTAELTRRDETRDGLVSTSSRLSRRRRRHGSALADARSRWIG
jgi:hypothetical protein